MSRGPSSTVTIWKGYEINGNTFYMIDQDEKSTNQNSGVRFAATTEKGKDTYYGYIVDIWELDYGHDFKVPLFKKSDRSHVVLCAKELSRFLASLSPHGRRLCSNRERKG